MAAPTRISFVAQNVADDATISLLGGDHAEDPVYPLTNLQDPRLWKYFKSSSGAGTTFYLDLDLGANGPAAQAIALVGWELASGTLDESLFEFSVYADTESTFTDPPISCLAGSASNVAGYFDSPNGTPPGLSSRNLFAAVVSAETTMRYWRIKVYHPNGGGSSWSLRANRIVLGPLVTPAHHFIYGAQLRVVDPTEFIEFPSGGGPERRPKEPYRELSVGFDNLSEAEALESFIAGLDLRVGRRGDVLVLPRPDSLATMQNAILWGPLSEMSPAALPVYNTWTKALVVRERLP